jgi:NAD(P)-dependent dehydrogenase (short-subunit alcohol dehydrogenase family)
MPRAIDRPVVVTGASKGIGRAAALHLAARGSQVFAGVRTEADGQALREASASPDRLCPVLVDVTDPQAIARAAETVRRAAPGGVSGIVNNAGIVVAGPLEFLPLDEVRLQFEVNVVGALAVTQAFLPQIRAGGGRIVNVSSLNGRVASPFVGPYCASKFALEALSDALRMELSRWRIPVVVIQPGAVATPIWETAAQRATANAKRMPDGGKQLYGRVLSVLADRAGRPPRHSIPPGRVARVIERALTARRPRTRYLVGTDAHLAALVARLMPDRAIDWLLTR